MWNHRVARPRAERLAARCLPVPVVLACAVTAQAQPAAPYAAVAFAPDTAVAFDGFVTNDTDLVRIAADGAASPVDLGSQRVGAPVNAYHSDVSGRLFVAESTTRVTAALTAEPRDVVRIDGSTVSLAFDGSGHGVPNGTSIDAVSLAADGALLLSFDTAVRLSGAFYADEDVVRFDGSGFSVLFAGAAHGVAAALDLNGLHFDPETGALLMTFDGSGAIGTLRFDDEDVLVYTPGAESWGMAFDGSQTRPALAAADLYGVYFERRGGQIFFSGFEDAAQ